MKHALIACVALVVACAPTPRPGIEPRNLVLVTFEALRADRTSAYLHARPTTAVAADEVARREDRAMGIDDLASTGVVFRNCFSPSPATVPALASLFTGRTPGESGVMRDGEVVPWDVPTLAELFAHSGFHTAAFATARNADLEVGVGRGFGVFESRSDDAATLARALDWIKRDAGDGARRFVWIHLAGLAPPFDAGANTQAVDDVLVQRQFGVGLPLDVRLQLLASASAVDEVQRARLAESYDQAVARASIALAQFLKSAFDYHEAGAEESETWARTVFTFTAPTGLVLGEDGGFGNANSLHESALHVPLVVRHPDSLTGQRVSSAVVDLTDLLPTFVEWFDLATPARVQGRSLLALLDSYVERTFEHRPAIARLEDGSTSARNERFHLVLRPASKPPSIAMFEPGRDPLERDDVARRFPEEFASLRAAVKAALANPVPRVAAGR